MMPKLDNTTKVPCKTQAVAVLQTESITHAVELHDASSQSWHAQKPEAQQPARIFSMLLPQQ
jgi:hypothetical protein